MSFVPDVPLHGNFSCLGLSTHCSQHQFVSALHHLRLENYGHQDYRTGVSLNQRLDNLALSRSNKLSTISRFTLKNMLWGEVSHL